jgi:acetylornithine deacetylase
MTIDDYTNDAVALLKALIATPSVSRNEKCAADIMQKRIAEYGFDVKRKANNVWAICPCYDSNKGTVLLNAHIDTVAAVKSWTKDPFSPFQEGDRIYGIGSNDCGGGLVSLLQVFRILSERELPFNVIYLASAEEEVSGADGISSVLPLLPPINVAIVGEPTGMQPAVAEKGLMVLDITAHGISGHAARGEGVNAIYQAMDDMRWIRDYRFDKVSAFLGPTMMNITMINAGTQHNVVPDVCKMVVDVRTNEYYDNEEVYRLVCQHVKSDVSARSFRLRSSHIGTDHPLVRRCLQLGLKPFGSPTLSDQALMPFPSLKIGPGQSSRSHSADEFICVSEIKEAIDIYMKLANI